MGGRHDGEGIGFGIKHSVDQLFGVHVVLYAVDLAVPFDPRRHLQQSANGRLAVERILQFGHIAKRRILEGLDAAFFKCDATSSDITDLAMEADIKRSVSVRPYW